MPSASNLASQAHIGDFAPALRDGTDARFKALLSEDAWQSLPLAVRHRFSKQLGAGRSVVYAGLVTDVAMSRLGWVIAQLARIIGAPLPLSRDTGVPTVVSVTEEGTSGGQNWTRIYGRRRGFPQVVHSTKRFCGPTGLEEHIGFGLAIALRVTVADGALRFESAGYRIVIGRSCLTLPRALLPLDLTVTHREIDTRSFEFTLELKHARLGLMIHQRATYTEDVS